MNRLGWSLLVIGALLPATLKAESAEPQPGFAGAFLVARAAEVRGDWPAAEAAFADVAARDPQPADFLHRESILRLNQGDFDGALGVAHRLEAGGNSFQLASLLAFTDAARAGHLSQAQQALNRIGSDGLGRFIQPFFAAWLASAAGQPRQAYALLDKAGEIKSLQPMLWLHTALIAEQAGDIDRARENYTRVLSRNPSYRVVALASSFYARHNMHDRRAALLRSAAQSGLEGSLVSSLAAMVPADPALQVRNWQEGLGEVLFNIAALLQIEGANDVALPYLRVAQALRPDFGLVRLMIADLHVRLGRYAQAGEMYEALAARPDVGSLARLHQAMLQRDLGNLAAAQQLAGQLAGQYGNWAQVWTLLGVLHLDAGQAGEAEKALTTGLTQLTPAAGSQATLLFARARSREAQHNWPGAEADLQAALKAEPDNADVLNYLAYMWAERGSRLEEAEGLARRALTHLPEDAGVMDTLGWVKFRQGEFGEAARLLELASELRPYDPTINDHLGDAYWAQGRHMEARFQWSRAMTYRDTTAPALVSVEALRQKIAQGIGSQLTAERH